ncbi:MAG: NADP-dependent phosphogluconate dehydrogenase [Desulfobacterales bacterium]
MTRKSGDIGLVGLGVMGRNLVLNIADHGFSVAGYDLDPDKARHLQQEKKPQHAISTATEVAAFLDLLRPPRAVMLLVPAGDPVDTVLDQLLPQLDRGDLIIDAGNSNFKDTDRRIQTAGKKNIDFMGMGVSGGEKGARNGPSLMPGGAVAAYERVRTIFEAAAARVDDSPCVAHLGPGSAGHYVKMVHNGIEYGIMELIAETYDLMKRGLNLSNDRLSEIYAGWDRTEVSGYLTQITARIFAQRDERTGNDLVDLILDRADQKGTGTWTVGDALDLQVPVPTIDLAVQMRNLSMLKRQRRNIAQSFETAPNRGGAGTDGKVFIERLRRAFYAGMILTYAQGFALLGRASQSYDYRLDLETIARIWRGGCIIRADLLNDIMAAFARRADLPNLLMDTGLGHRVAECREDLAAVIGYAAAMGIPAPGLMVSLAYFDALRSARLPANLIQAQRDYFGAHTYERKDAEGHFHTNWES